jgi:ADP-dependent NAD(P)H-hydrate dehydratase / NAD(P)H-hydrate epimerase
MAMLRIKRRNRNTHKGNYGHVLVIAGSAGMTGAAYLSSEAAIISGAGLVTLAIPKSLNPIMQRKFVEVMTLPLTETKDKSLALSCYDKIHDFTKKADCVLIGPGLSRNSQTQALIRSLIKNIKLPMVIDADALNALAGHLHIISHNRQMVRRAHHPPNHPEQSRGTGTLAHGSASSPSRAKSRDRQTIITPHPGEMARLIDKKTPLVVKDKKNVAKKFASKYNITTVLKGFKTVVASPENRLYINNTGNPGMASAGCGDVLSGIIAALLASGMEPFKAARLGVYVHGLAGDIAVKEIGEISLRARDLLRFLPEAFKKVYG